ncbi:hypothetical protein AAVH_38840 [Aphelenchoides avenae]|nr:hypothetical protein AAVH_38840 [Aphelenchus avenae]
MYNVPYYYAYDYCRNLTGIALSVLNWDSCLIHVNELKSFWIFELMDSAVSYGIPLAITVPLYACTCYTLWPRLFLKGKKDHSEPCHFPEQSANSRRQVMKMLLICLLIFVVCYTPMAVHLFRTSLANTVEEWRAEYVFFNCVFLQGEN